MTFLTCQLRENSHALTNCIYINQEELEGICFANKKPFFVKHSTMYEKNKVGLNMKQRVFMSLSFDTPVTIEKFSGTVEYLPNVTMNISTRPGISSQFEFTHEEIVNQIKMKFNNIPLIQNLAYTLEIDGNVFFLVITKVQDNKVICLNEDTNIEVVSLSPNLRIPSVKGNTLFKGNFNFNELGIGGLDQEFETIFRRAFSTRLLPESILKDLGINHVRGILLYGPPGCGKTLIARKIGSVLDCHEPKIVNGPSLLSKYVGESEENVRKLFKDAMEDTTSNKVHLIICDEFDAICKKRGSRNDSTGVNDNVVNQLLSMIDGPQSLNNILLICMTNKKDALDEAVLRPGRLEVQIEIHLPDEKGRFDILQIHTRQMNNKKYLENVKLDEISSLTKNYTGAELESVVKTAVSYSIAREINPNGVQTTPNISVKHDDFLRAVDEVKPMFGTRSSDIEILTNTPLLFLNNLNKVIHTDILKSIQTFTANKLSILVTGSIGCGKTTLLAHIAKQTGIDCIKFINSETLIQSNDKAMTIYDTMEQAMKPKEAVIFLDSIEHIIEYSSLGSIYNNKILQTIFTLVNKNIERGKKIVLLLSSSNRILMDTLGISKMVDFEYKLDDIVEGTDTSIKNYFKQMKFSKENVLTIQGD